MEKIVLFSSMDAALAARKTYGARLRSRSIRDNVFHAPRLAW